MAEQYLYSQNHVRNQYRPKRIIEKYQLLYRYAERWFRLQYAVII